jgi:hypothetical protein
VREVLLQVKKVPCTLVITINKTPTVSVNADAVAE